MSEFKPIPGYEEYYRINSHGVVQSRWRHDWRELKHEIMRTGYHRVGLCLGNKKKKVLVHRLVLMTFGDPIPFADALGLHKDDNREHNSIDNLYWGTHKDNRADAMRSGRAVTRNHVVLKRQEVVAILKAGRFRGYLKILSEQFGITKGAVSNIMKRRTWKEIDHAEFA